VTTVDVRFEQANGVADLRVDDNAPEGFADLSHAYTLFAESKKKANPQQRGRFNLGEKLVIALCDYAAITTTKGQVIFDHDGRHQTRLKREVGTMFEGTMRMNKQEAAEVERLVRTVIPPARIDTYFNGELLPYRPRVAYVGPNLLAFTSVGVVLVIIPVKETRPDWNAVFYGTVARER
jgi:hypothetical protein